MGVLGDFNGEYFTTAVLSIGVVASIITLIGSFISLTKLKSFRIDTFDHVSEEEPTQLNGMSDYILSDKVKFNSNSLSSQEKQNFLLEKYHNQVLMHSNFSFWFSMVFASLGFMMILTSMYSLVKSGSFLDQGPAIMKIISGTIIDSVSALLIVQSNKMRKSMTVFFDKLRSDRKLEETLKLIETIKEPELQDRLKIVIALEFVEINKKDDFFKSLLIIKENENKIG